jgi:RNA polymerase sigma factor (sigma-70 family)
MVREAKQVSAMRASLVRYVRRGAAEAVDVEDIVQESWLRMAAAPEAPVSAGGYLRRIARNLMIDCRRRAASGVEQSMAPHDLAGLPAAQPGPESLLIARDTLDRIDRALSAMPARRREAFRLVRVEGMTFAEVARLLGISRQTVHEHVTLALLAIQAAADADG